MQGTSSNGMCDNLMYHPYSTISSTYIPLVSTKVNNRELQVDLMCSSIMFPIFL